MNTVSIIAWIATVAYLVWQTTRRSPSPARTGGRGRRLRDRPGNGSMRTRFTPPPRYHPEGDPDLDPVQAEGASAVIPSDHLKPPDQLAFALAGLTPSMLCTLCVIELKQARIDGRPDPEVHPGIVMSGIITSGSPSMVMLCEVRHPLNIGTPTPPSLLVAPADAALDPAAALRTLGLAAGA